MKVVGISRDQVDRVARIYHLNADAGAALGITMRSFSRLCRRFDIETVRRRDMGSPGN